MRIPAVSAHRLKPGGFVVAAVGFLLSQYILAESLWTGGRLLAFVVGPALFLLAGLSLTVFGVGLAVSSYSREYVNTVAQWCLLGVGSMLLVVGLLHAESVLAGRSPTVSGRLASRVLVGGSVGGVLTGVRSATSRRQRRDLSGYADRLTVLNRILRHEVLNKVNVIRGYADLDLDGDREAREVIRRNAEHVDRAIGEVGFLTAAGRDGPALAPVDVTAVAADRVEWARERYPEAVVDLELDVLEGTEVRANDRLGEALTHLLENAVEHNDSATPHVRVEVAPTDVGVEVRVVDDGPGLPADQRTVLLGRELPEYDDPTVGFGLPITRLLVEEFGGRVDVETGVADGSGTAVSLELLRPSVARGQFAGPQHRYGVEPRRLVEAGVAALVAGVAMGALIQGSTGALAVIGALYGASNVAVGWLMHLFHSVVFGVVFVALVSLPRFEGVRGSPAMLSALGVAFGAVLWLFASSFVMPVWLRFVGVDATIPDLNLVSLLGHLVWGATLGGLFGVVRGHVRVALDLLPAGLREFPDRWRTGR